MQVYVLCQVFAYEGEYLLGVDVYASREEAVAAADRYLAEQAGSVDQLALYTREVGTAAVLDASAIEYFDGTE